MSTWTERARQHFLQKRQNSTAETAESHSIFIKEVGDSTAETIETPLLAVLAVSTPPLL